MFTNLDFRTNNHIRHTTGPTVTQFQHKFTSAATHSLAAVLDQGSLRRLNPERLLRANRVPYVVEVELKYDFEY